MPTKAMSRLLTAISLKIGGARTGNISMQGGAVAVYYGELTVLNSEFINNQTAPRGSGGEPSIALDQQLSRTAPLRAIPRNFAEVPFAILGDGDVVIRNSTFNNNTALGDSESAGGRCIC